VLISSALVFFEGNSRGRKPVVVAGLTIGFRRRL